MEFFKYPTTPHLLWLGSKPLARSDKLIPKQECLEFLKREVIIEEKIDGANIGISISEDGSLRVQNRGQYIDNQFFGQFSRLENWLSLRGQKFMSALPKNAILFGEWCAAVHTIFYDRLPDYFLLFDVYDVENAEFWSVARRDDLAENLELKVVPKIFKGQVDKDKVLSLLLGSQSRFSSCPMEGLVMRTDDALWLLQRAKVVHPNFIQSVNQHWTKRAITWNQLA